MLKTVITIILLVVLSWLAVKGFISQLGVVSATRNKDRRAIEFGLVERTIITVVPSVVFILLMISSNIRILAVILGVALSVCLVLLNTYLRSNGLRLLPTFFLFWVATVISTSTYAHFTSKDTLGTVYIVLQVICLILLLVGTAVSNTQRFYNEHKEENEEADKIKVALRLARGETVDEDKGGSEIISKIIKVLPIIIMILITILLLSFLEAKFDFLPPYNF